MIGFWKTASKHAICVFLHVFNIYVLLDIKTHNSESRGQEEAAIIRESKIRDH